jgi:hypothetical protein
LAYPGEDVDSSYIVPVGIGVVHIEPVR